MTFYNVVEFVPELGELTGRVVQAEGLVEATVFARDTAKAYRRVVAVVEENTYRYLMGQRAAQLVSVNDAGLPD